MAFPTVVTTSTFQSDSTASATKAVTLPASIVSGNLLVMVFCGRDTVPTPPSGWAGSSPTANLYVFTRTADGSEGATVNVTMDSAFRCAAITYQFNGATGVEVGTADASTDPPNLSPAAGSADYLWLSVFSSRRSDWSVTSEPTNYDDLITSLNPSNTATSRIGVATAHRTTTASSEDQAAWTISGTTSNPTAWAIAIQGTGSSPASGSATGTIGWAGSATGARTSSGAASGAVGWAGAATGTAARSGTATGSVTWAGTATGATVRAGTASGSSSWAGSAQGATVRTGSVSGTITWAGDAAGVAPTTEPSEGAATGTVTWAGSATGTTTRTGDATGGVTWAGSATSIEYIAPTMHAPVWQEPSHAPVWTERSHAATYHENSYAATYRETRR